MRTALRTTLRPMTADDITQVADVERESFPSMWPQTAYKRVYLPAKAGATPLLAQTQREHRRAVAQLNELLMDFA